MRAIDAPPGLSHAETWQLMQSKSYCLLTSSIVFQAWAWRVLRHDSVSVTWQLAHSSTPT